jgi:phosphoglycerol transferase
MSDRPDGDRRATTLWGEGLLVYGGAALVSLLAAVLLLELWKADLRVPFDYGGDALSFALVVKSIVDHGWYLTNPSLGAPFGLELHDFPFADSLHLLVIKLMSSFTSDWALLFNLYFLLGFPLIAMSAMAVFRHYRVPPLLALTASVLYAFLPSRLLKGEGHIFMDVFFQVPLAVLVALWVMGDEPPLTRDSGRRWPGLELRRGRSIAAVLICLITSCTGLYYAFFTGFLLLAGGGWASLRRHTFRPLVAGAILAGVIAAGVAANGLPTMIYRARQGQNPQVAVRPASDAELYALKPVELVLPVDGHRLRALARFKQSYRSSPPALGEEGSSLGLMGTIGLLALLGALVAGRPRMPARAELFRSLAALNIFMLVLGVVGGLGSLFALLVTPQVRTYARVNVVIGFLALFALALLLERLAMRRPRLAEILAALALGLGLLDQASLKAVRPYAAVAAQYRVDAELVRRIEAAVPGESMIFQLPYLSFPEAAPLHDMGAYDAVRPYLHSRSLRWSQPAMRGRAGDAWLAEVSRRDPAELVQAVTAAGFQGILVDRDGYADHGAQIERALFGLLGAEPLVGGELSFFTLGRLQQRAQAELTPEAREQRRDRALHPVFFSWAGGFSGVETDSGRSWRWCSGSGEILIENGSRTARPIAIRMTVIAGKPPAHLDLDGDLVSRRLELGPRAIPLALSLSVPPGRHRITFRSDGRPADAAGDPRTLVWRAEDPVLEEGPDPPE